MRASSMAGMSCFCLAELIVNLCKLVLIIHEGSIPVSPADTEIHAYANQ